MDRKRRQGEQHPDDRDGHHPVCRPGAPERFVELCEKAPGSVQERSEGTTAHLAATTEELSEESDERGQGACFHLDLVGVTAAGL
jgi:hypothetical protein